MAEYRLGDAEQRHRDSPRTFFIPGRAEREGLAPGDMAQLLFEIVEPADDGPSAERMWVGVTDVADGRYGGELTNRPGFLTTIALGDRVEFGPEHVIRLVEDWPDGELKAMVSGRSHDDDVRPGFVVREEPMNEQDSGWQVLVGDETPEELDDASRILLQPLGFLVDRWPELRAVFDEGEAGSEWVWDAAAGAYVRLER